MTTSVQEQVVREASEIEARKLGLMDLAKQLGETPINLPGYQIAGMAPEQMQAVQLAQQGLGSYLPYMQQAGAALQQAGGLYAGLPQFGSNAVGAVTGGANLANLYGAAGSMAYDPNSVSAFMNPYQQAATQATLGEIGRQGRLAQTGIAAQAARSGAFGGSREGVQRAELQRNVLDQQARTAAQDYSTNYQQAQQAAMGAFHNQQARMQQAGNLALGAAQAVGQANVSAGQLQQAGAAGIAGLGAQTANLGQQISGLGQGDVSFMYNIGQRLQEQNQKQLDAARQTALQAQYEPYQRISFLSDIYRGAPSSQQTISQATAPAPSLLSQVGGLGIAGLSAYNLINK